MRRAPPPCVEQRQLGEALGGADERRQAPPHRVGAAQLERADPEHEDEVVGVPEAVGVRLAEPDAAAARDERVEARRVDRDLGPQLRLGRAEAEPLARPVLDQLEPSGADPPQGAVKRCPGGALDHRAALGWGWNGAPLSFSRAALP